MARNLYSFDDLENKFPVDVDDWHTFIDADLGMLSNIARYKQLYANGDLEGAAEVLNENPELRRAIINAETLNRFRDAIISIERFYLNDVQQWIIELVDYKGDFDSTTRYTKYDVVTFARNGAIETFVAHQIEIPIGTLPSDTNYWVPITLRGQQGASGLGLAARGTWNSLEQYTVNDWVIWNNKAWAAENDNTNSEPSEDNPDWYVVVDNYQRVVVSETEPTGQVAGDIWAQETENGVIFNEKQLDGTYIPLSLNFALSLDCVLLADSWIAVAEFEELYKQTITSPDIVQYIQANKTSVDCLADYALRLELEDAGVEEIWAENQNGTLVIFSKGSLLSTDITIQLRLINIKQ